MTQEMKMLLIQEPRPDQPVTVVTVDSPKDDRDSRRLLGVLFKLFDSDDEWEEARPNVRVVFTRKVGG